MNKRDIQRQARDLIRASVADLEDYGAKTDDGDAIESTFLGTVFSVMPSGKYYMPWANSNVDLCPRCKGNGCDYCGGLGSREAHEDEIMQEALEAEAGKLGCYVESGEGDPCDLFLCRVVEQEEDDE